MDSQKKFLGNKRQSKYILSSDDEEEEYDAETYGEAKYETEATLFSITVK